MELHLNGFSRGRDENKKKRERERSRKLERFKTRMSLSPPCHTAARQPQRQVPGAGQGQISVPVDQRGWDPLSARSPPARRAAGQQRIGSSAAELAPKASQNYLQKPSCTKGNAAGVF